MINAIQLWLESVGLPWRTPRGELVAQAGGKPSSREDRLPIQLARPPLQGLLAPFSIRLSPLLAPKLPPTLFLAQTSFGLDPHENLRRTAAELAAALGEVPVEAMANTVRVTWTANLSSIQLMAWPVTAESGNRPNARHATSCLVILQSGFLPPLNPLERQALASLNRLGEVRTEPDSGVDGPGEHEIEFLRDAAGATDIGGTIGLSADRRLLIGRNQHLFVLQVSSILKADIARLLPAHGPGGSKLDIVCRPDGAGPVKAFAVTSAPGPDDLTALGATLARAMGVPLALGAYGYDC